ncbi:hypothetical protein [Salinivibrio sp. IB872]|uniref:hypothetical protein n=1 Tax=Salinivibrio sp. IB872 TaxID=1766123 RepID=UPI00098676DD|nr:hypothetical protein [Salinivibrio sp. IB872]OOF22964.1 hypothetical protein BZJ18_14580 [Salinivibrio sp. IB872]
MLWLLGITFSVSATEMTVAYRVHTDESWQATQAIITQAMARVDPEIELQWIAMPLKRAEISLNKGIIDADTARTQFAYQHSDVVTYPSAPLFRVDYYLYGRTHVLSPQEYTQVVGLFGDQFAQKIAQKYQWNMLWARSESAALSMLQNERAQAMVGPGMFDDELGGEALSLIRQSEKPIASVSIFMVFHQRHAALAKRVGAVLQSMNDSGTTAAILAKHGL